MCLVLFLLSSSVSKTSRLIGILEVFWKERSLERMGKVPLEIQILGPLHNLMLAGLLFKPENIQNLQ